MKGVFSPLFFYLSFYWNPMATASNLLSALSRAYILSETRSGGDPDLVEALEDVREIHGDMGWQVVRIEARQFIVLDEVVSVEGGDLARLRDAFEGAQLLEIRLQELLEPEVLEDFLRRTHPSPDQGPVSGPERFRGLEEALGLSFRENSASLRGMAGSVQDLFAPRDEGEGEALPEPLPTPPPVEESAPLDTDSPAEEDSLPDAYRYAGPQQNPDLAVDVQGYLDASPSQKAQLGQAILAAAIGLKAERSMAALAELVEALASSQDGTPDPDALELAREIISPSIASHLVARLGEIRDEEERASMISLCSGLGREMALALADALGEARDRYQRRSFMDAMVAQGDLALEVAQGMVEDPRWFVVRNGVSLMGEMGGEGVVSHITGSLANADPRVRREAVLALAKLGGADAEQLLRGMLDDREAEVRAMACRAVGVLKVEKALKSLLNILEEDQDEDVQVECLQALGKIGDPGAVPLIEKRAVKGLFSRPNQEIRVAAYRALAGIGTPHAMSLPEKAATDSDVSVRTVVQALLE